MGMGLFIVALLLLLSRVDGVGRDGLMSVVMVDSKTTVPTYHNTRIGNHPLSEAAASFHDSRDAFEDKLPSHGDVPPDFFCHSCQEVSRKVEKFLTDPSLYDEVDTLSTEVCHMLRSDLRVKCRRLVELYLREGILLLQIVFLEKNLCNGTGFCPFDNNTLSLSTSHNSKVMTFIEPDFASLRKTGLPPPSKINLSPFKVRERKRCDACHVAAEQIRKGLEDHEQQIKVIKSLLEACQSVRSYADRCKRLVFQYGPLVLANLQKFLSSKDFCHLVHMCENPVPPEGKTNHMYLSM